MRYLLPVALVATLSSLPGHAATLTEYTNAISTTGGYHGQSFTIPTAGQYNNISFSFLLSGTPTAAGTLYLFSTSNILLFGGRPDNLAALAPFVDLVGTATASGGVYTFAPGLILSGNHLYYAFADSSFPLTGSGGGGPAAYPGGNYFTTGVANAPFGPISYDANFRVSGRAIIPTPEPASWTLMIGGFGLAGTALRRRARVRLALG